MRCRALQNPPPPGLPPPSPRPGLRWPNPTPNEVAQLRHPRLNLKGHCMGFRNFLSQKIVPKKMGYKNQHFQTAAHASKQLLKFQFQGLIRYNKTKTNEPLKFQFQGLIRYNKTKTTAA